MAPIALTATHHPVRLVAIYGELERSGRDVTPADGGVLEPFRYCQSSNCLSPPSSR
jgi:hypothetical protein